MIPSAPARTGAWAVLVSCILARAITTNDPFPIWSTDPLHFSAPSVGLGPSAGLALDLVAIATSLILLFLDRARLMAGPTLLVSLGAIAALFHSRFAPGSSLDDLRLGAHWTAAMSGALALAHACRDRTLWARTWALFLALACMLAVKGLLQVFVEHPATVAAFESNRDGFLASQGWTPDSFMARSYERRLRQPEATGWFGLSNVLGSFAALATIALVPLTIRAWASARAANRPFPDGFAGLITLASASAAITLFFTHSKGATAAALAGLSLVALVASSRAKIPVASRVRPYLLAGGGAIALAFLVAPILAVLSRGVLGETLGERSLLFRAFYLVGGTRIVLEHPLLGVGPAGFKQAYLLAKPPLSPEDVDSPHSLFMDYLATLGILGAAWIATIVLWVRHAGRALLATIAPDPTHRDDPASIGIARPDILAIVGVAAIAVGVSAWSESHVVSIEFALARLVGLAAWAGCALAILSLFRREVPLAPVVCGALALAAHLMFDVTGTWVGSAPLALSAVACAASPITTNFRERRSIPALPAIALLAMVSLGGFGSLAPEVFRWEHALRRAGDQALPAGAMAARVRALASGVSPERPERVLDDLSTLIGYRVPFSARDVDEALADLVRRRLAAAADLLDQANARHLGTLEALSRTRLSLAISLDSPGNTLEALRDAELAATRFPTSRSYAWLATVANELHRATGDPALQDRALAAWLRAALLDPHGVAVPVRLARLHALRAEPDAASTWAAEALRRNDNLRLDPLRQLRESEREEMTRLSSTP